MTQYAQIKYQSDLTLYDKWRRDQTLQLDITLKQIIANFVTKYEKLQIKDRFDQMITDFGNQALKQKIQKLCGDDNIIKTGLQDLVLEFHDRFQQIIEYEGSFNEQMDHYIEQIQEVHKDYIDNVPQFEQENFFDYLIYHDSFWKQSFRELVEENFKKQQKILKEQQPIISIKVSFYSEIVLKMYEQVVQNFINQLIDLREIQQPIDYEKKKQEILKIIFACFIKFRHTNSQKLFFSQDDRLSLNKFEPLVNKEDAQLVTFQNPYQFLHDGLDIQLTNICKINEEILINSMDQLLDDQKYYFISYEQTKPNENNTVKIVYNECQVRKLQNFFTYFYYYKSAKKEEQRLQYAFVPSEILIEGKKKMEKECFGIEEFLNNNQMICLHDDFKNPLSFYGCRGPLIYGPPGTGKTYIIQRMISFYEIHLVFDGNSSTFQGSLVGQGSRLLQIYFNRAKAIPWQACAAHIGEIEQLVKKKDKEGGGGGSQEVLNKLLELMDGTETVGNVKVFSTTNHVEMIEEAILSRFRQVYLGKSNTSLRRDWIVWYLMNIKKQGGIQSQQFNEIMEGFFSKTNNEFQQFLTKSNDIQQQLLKERIKDIVDYSINFSTRQLKDLVSNITSKMIQKQLTYDSTPNDKLKVVVEFCKTLGVENFLFGNKILPQLMFDTTVNNSSKFNEELDEKFLRIAANGQRLEQSQIRNQQDQYNLSRIVFIDLSTDPRERINILKQREKSFESMNKNQHLQNIYLKLNILILSKFKIEQVMEQTKNMKWNLSNFKEFLSSLKLLKDANVTSLQSATKFLEKLDINKFEKINQENIQKRLISQKTLYDFRMSTNDMLLSDIKKYLDCVRFLDINDQLQEINQQIAEDKEGEKLITNLNNYLAFIEQKIDDFSTELLIEIDHSQLQDFTIEQIVNQNKFYKLDYCSLLDTSYDYILLLLSYFIKNGDFSKVDMVDYHSCERNKVHDINSFKDYISNITKEAMEEEKSLIVYKLDEILDVAHQEDAELEKEYREMGMKIFQSINLDASNSKQWTIFISKNQNVIDLFYNTVTYWPRESRKGQEISIQQDQLKLRTCKICKNKFKFAEEDDQCKQHTSDKFFINKNQEMYKKFEDNWQNTYLQEYEKRQDHQKNHHNFSVKGCDFCENKKTLSGYNDQIFEMEKDSFNTLKSLGIIPYYYKNYDQILKYKKPVDIKEIQEKIDREELYNGDVKRVCCDSNFSKEECNPHKHIEDNQEKKDDLLKAKTNDKIMEILLKKLNDQVENNQRNEMRQ